MTVTVEAWDPLVFDGEATNGADAEVRLEELVELEPVFDTLLLWVPSVDGALRVV